ncbi:sugar phosphate isomerase/epimerase family protein [Paenibacillus spongiae]|uniref:Sugar phosphate isomerase/epimerase n=1 Tax=Paenibacillus spongiae TaxID=2909671 RepID=A0ABY5SHN1_9BACL|nr:sugar phosphate isomerase/epimerase [Paenibacillus spongiae]UVI32148.1 sugar phosphate isomerase/epimerase [Paenibacillus spongiae]
MRLGIVIHSMGLPHHDIVGALRRCQELGIMALQCGSEPLHDPVYFNEVKAIIEDTGIELIIGFGDRYIEHADKQPTDGFVRLVETICMPLKVTRIPTCSTHHRWRQDPPLAQQLDRMGAALHNLCEAAKPYGVRIAVENHADYRGSDLVQMFKQVNHPSLGAQLDTGNAYSVAEDPLTAAMALAPYTISTHIKDMTVRPLTEGEWIKVKGCGIGEGDVDFRGIVDILTEHCPEADDLPYNLEIEPPPGADLPALTESGVAYTMKHLSHAIRSNKRY